MKQVLITAALCLSLTGPALSDEHSMPDMDDLRPFAEGMQELLEGLTNDLAPLLDKFADQLEGLNGYHPPEMLPNGDIIIRRKAPQDVAPEAGRDGTIDI